MLDNSNVSLMQGINRFFLSLRFSLRYAVRSLKRWYNAIVTWLRPQQLGASIKRVPCDIPRIRMLLVTV